MSLDTVEPVRLDVAGHRVSLHLLELGLACCGLEVRAGRRLADATGQLVAAGDGDAGPDDLHLLVLAGTVTARLAPAVRSAWEALPEPRAVLAFGACTASGGPYWDSYSVVPGAHELVPVDAWVPGCPPRPQELLDGIREVLRGRA